TPPGTPGPLASSVSRPSPCVPAVSPIPNCATPERSRSTTRCRACRPTWTGSSPATDQDQRIPFRNRPGVAENERHLKLLLWLAVALDCLRLPARNHGAPLPFQSRQQTCPTRQLRRLMADGGAPGGYYARIQCAVP